MISSTKAFSRTGPLLVVLLADDVILRSFPPSLDNRSTRGATYKQQEVELVKGRCSSIY